MSSLPCPSGLAAGAPAAPRERSPALLRHPPHAGSAGSPPRRYSTCAPESQLISPPKKSRCKGTPLLYGLPFVWQPTVEPAGTSVGHQPGLRTTGDPVTGLAVQEPATCCAVGTRLELEPVDVLRPQRRAPLSQLGLRWPWFRSVLRGGIAYTKGLPFAGCPRKFWMLTLRPNSSCAAGLVRAPVHCLRARQPAVLGVCLPGSYSSLCFHIARTIAARRLARVNLARFGSDPDSTARW